MHLISELIVNNFRSIRAATFPLSAFTPLVGINNAGKSNVLRALNRLISGGKQLPPAEFGDTGTPVQIMARVTGIDDGVLAAIGEAHRNIIGQRIVGGALLLRRTWSASGEAGPLEISPDGAEWERNPRGIDEAIKALFPEPVLVEAMEDAAEQMVKTTASTAIGRLMKEITAAIVARNAGPANAALAEHFARLRADSPDRDPELARIDTILARELQGLFGGVQAQIDIQPPDFVELVKGASVRLRDTRFGEDVWRSPSDMGHGAQRSVLVALIRCLAELRSGEAPGRTTLLLIDEPELYLHPQAVEALRGALRRLAGGGWQVVFSTHSPMMIGRDDIQDTLLIRRSQEAGTHPLLRMRDALQHAIGAAEHQAELLFALTHSSRVLFADRVLLVEGKTEQQLLPAVWTLIRGRSPGEEGVALVDLTGASDLLKARQILSAMGISISILADLDFAFDRAIRDRLIQRDHPDLDECRKLCRDHGITPLHRDGRPQNAEAATRLAAVPGAARPIAEIHDHLRQQGIWVWPKGDIEAQFGLPNKSVATRLIFLNRLKNGEEQSALESADALFRWLFR